MMNGNKFAMVLTYYKNEIELKSKMIRDLRNQIDEIEKEKIELKNKIELLKFENFKIKEQYENTFYLQHLKHISSNHFNDEINRKNDDNNEPIENSKNNSQFENECENCKKLNDNIFDYSIANRKNEEIIERLCGFFNRINDFFSMKYKVNSENKLDLVNVYDNEYLESCLMQLEKILYKKNKIDNLNENNIVNRYSARGFSQKNEENDLFFPNKQF